MYMLALALQNDWLTLLLLASLYYPWYTDHHNDWLAAHPVRLHPQAYGQPMYVYPKTPFHAKVHVYVSLLFGVLGLLTVIEYFFL
jgi:hypothetical protein